MSFDIDWTKQHCGLRSASYSYFADLMPDVLPVIDTFPDNVFNFSFDVKVHMLMPGQFPCIPNWHYDNVPRVDGVQRFDKCRPELPMYLWVSNGPLTQFEHGFVLPQRWFRFNQLDKHRGIAAAEFGWRCFIRATHVELLTKPIRKKEDCLRRHSQVYCDPESYQW